LVDFQSAFIHPLTHVEFIAGDGSHVNSAEFVAAEEIFPSEAAHDKQKKLAGYFFVKFPLYYSKKKNRRWFFSSRGTSSLATFRGFFSRSGLFPSEAAHQGQTKKACGLIFCEIPKLYCSKKKSSVIFLFRGTSRLATFRGFFSRSGLFPSEAAHEGQTKKACGLIFCEIPKLYCSKKNRRWFFSFAARVVSRPSAGSFRAPAAGPPLPCSVSGGQKAPVDLCRSGSVLQLFFAWHSRECPVQRSKHRFGSSQQRPHDQD
jgi:hypothetical protein